MVLWFCMYAACLVVGGAVPAQCDVVEVLLRDQQGVQCCHILWCGMQGGCILIGVHHE